MATKMRWQLLLEAGSFSIGYFVVTSYGGKVRIYHERAKSVCHCTEEESFNEMQRLCTERGYTLQYVLARYTPKSYQNNWGHLQNVDKMGSRQDALEMRILKT